MDRNICVYSINIYQEVIIHNPQSGLTNGKQASWVDVKNFAEGEKIPYYTIIDKNDLGKTLEKIFGDGYKTHFL